jgi:hypothetical protein
MIGGNNIYHNNSDVFLENLSFFFSNKHSDVHIILCTIPIRHDLPVWSVVDVEIRNVNKKLVELQFSYKKVLVLDIENIVRHYHTVHGLHLNRLGKILVCDELSIAFQNILSNQMEPYTETISIKTNVQRN